MPDLLLASTDSNIGAHDIAFVNNDFQLTQTEDQSLAQRLTVKLRTWLGEFYLDSSVGMPYLESIFGKNRSLDSIKAIFQDAIIEEDEVEQLVTLNVSLDKANRILSVTFNVRSASGDELIPVELQL